MKAPPLVAPQQRLDHGPEIRLPFPMARRIEDGSVVFWHAPKRITFWITTVACDGRIDDLLDAWRADRSPGAFDERVESDETILRFSYRVVEAEDGQDRESFLGLVQAGNAECVFAAYHDDPELLDQILETCRSIGAGSDF